MQSLDWQKKLKKNLLRFLKKFFLLIKWPLYNV